MKETPDLNRKIADLKVRYAQLEEKLPQSQTVDEYDAIVKELWHLDYEIDILLAKRDIARWTNEPAQE
jgi:hypothetical protein